MNLPITKYFSYMRAILSPFRPYIISVQFSRFFLTKKIKKSQ